MSKYTDKAAERRSHMTPEGRPAFNCCQTVASVFAEDIGCDEAFALRAATYFRGGMQMGSVCGAVTGGLMALGLAGADDPEAAKAFCQRFRDAHGTVDCAELLRMNAERGGVKLPFCNALIRECVGYVEEILREKGKLKEE